MICLENKARRTTFIKEIKFKVTADIEEKYSINHNNVSDQADQN